jgi:hypothetical protein
MYSRSHFVQITLTEAMTSISFATSTVLVNRLMISVRKDYYDRASSNVFSAPDGLPSIDFHSRETIEMTPRTILPPEEAAWRRDAASTNMLDCRSFNERGGF